MFKKLLLVAAVVSLSGCAVYTRHGSVQVDPVVVAPAPVVVYPRPYYYYGHPYYGHPVHPRHYR